MKSDLEMALPGETRIMVHFIINNDRVWKKWLNHLPSKGQLVRIENEFYLVGSICWCPAEQKYERVNIQLTLEPEH